MGASAYLKLFAVCWAEVFNAYVVWLMMPYLTQVRKLIFTEAAAIVNFWRGLTQVLPIFMLYLVHTLTGDFWMLLLSTLANCAGLGLLALSTPAVLAKETGSCTAYEYSNNCINKEKRLFFVISLFLMAIGISGVRSSLFSLLKQNVPKKMKEEEEVSATKALGYCLGLIVVVLIPWAALISLSYIKPWSIKFGLPAIVAMVATLVFLSGSCHYKREPPSGSPFTVLLRVLFVATIWNRYIKPPFYAFEAGNAHDPNTLPRTDGLSCLDKAAYYKPQNQSLYELSRKRWTLCTVTEVEETKIVIRCLPMCASFIVCGLVSAIGHSYFMAQATTMKRGHFPLLMLPYICDIWKSIFNQFYKGCQGKPGKYGPSIGIGISMVFAGLCCLTASKVESRRLDVVERKGLVDKPDDDAVVPMFVGWLIPQFVLLGAMEGIFEYGITGFFTNQVPSAMATYMNYLSEGIRGVGTISSFVSVGVMAIRSEKGGTQPSWFQDTLNKSRLDKYYWKLAVLVALNLVFYTWMAFRFKHRDPPAEPVNAPNEFQHELPEIIQEGVFQDPDQFAAQNQ